MSTTLIGNAISFIANICLILSSIKKDKNQILIYQIFFYIFIGAASHVLGAYSVVLLNALGVIRNICVLTNKNTKIVNIIIFVLSVSLAIIFNTNGYWGYLPVISACIENYIILNPQITVKKIKFAFMLSSLCWAIFDFAVLNYVGALSNLGALFLNGYHYFKKDKN